MPELEGSRNLMKKDVSLDEILLAEKRLLSQLNGANRSPSPVKRVRRGAPSPPPPRILRAGQPVQTSLPAQPRNEAEAAGLAAYYAAYGDALKRSSNRVSDAMNRSDGRKLGISHQRKKSWNENNRIQYLQRSEAQKFPYGTGRPLGPADQHMPSPQAPQFVPETNSALQSTEVICLGEKLGGAAPPPLRAPCLSRVAKTAPGPPTSSNVVLVIDGSDDETVSSFDDLGANRSNAMMLS